MAFTRLIRYSLWPSLSLLIVIASAEYTQPYTPYPEYHHLENQCQQHDQLLDHGLVVDHLFGILIDGKHDHNEHTTSGKAIKFCRYRHNLRAD